MREHGNLTQLTIGISINHAMSTGTVRLHDSNPASPPLIDPQYLSNDIDLDVFVEGM